MRILLLTDYFPPDKLGGVGEIASNLRREYENKGHHTWVLTTGPSDTRERIVRGSKSLILGVFLNNIKAIQLIRRERIDVVHLHQSTTSLFLLTRFIPFLYKKFPQVTNSAQVSYISEFQHIRTLTVRGRTFTPTRSEYIEKWIFSPVHILLDFVGFVVSDTNTVVSCENKRELERSYGRIARQTIHIVPNGVNTTDFAPREPDLDEAVLGRLAGKTVLLYVGVFRVRKRVFNLLYALQETVQTNSEVILVLVGGGRDYEDDVLALASELGIQDNVLFVGRVPNERVIHYLSAADVFCLVSSYEGMPIAILEAMASGKAILTSSVCGMVDLMSHGSDGFLTDLDDIDDIARRMLQFVEDPAMTRRMGEAARAKAQAKYEWSIIADRYLDLFQS